MKTSNLVRLFVLAALWGASFLFIRVAARDVPPAVLMGARVAIAAVFLVLVMGVPRLPSARDERRAALWRLLMLGALNSALPFVLIAWAARSLDASMLAILNATAPGFAVALTALASRAAPPLHAVVGLAVGAGGVAVTVGGGHIPAGATVAIAASLCAALSYGVAAVLAKLPLPGAALPSSTTASGSMIAASACLALPVLWSVVGPGGHAATLTSAPSASSLMAVLALGVACTGVAYLLYFRLLADEGPVAALSVTLLVPVFGVAWSALVLDESIGPARVFGGALVLAGTLLTNRAPSRLARPTANRSAVRCAEVCR